MTDNVSWRELPAGRELNRVIAEKLGWSEIEEREYYEEGYEWSGFARILVGRRPDGEDDCRLPAFSTDANAALTLISAVCADLFTNPGGYGCEVGDTDDRVAFNFGFRRYVGTADTPALAIARAWLAWMDAKAVNNE